MEKKWIIAIKGTNTYVGDVHTRKEGDKTICDEVTFVLPDDKDIPGYYTDIASASEVLFAIRNIVPVQMMVVNYADFIYSNKTSK